MAIKLYLANAFDRVRNSFLYKVLDRFGFPPPFVRWVKAYIDNPWMAPLVNGRPTAFFQANRGIRQGYPLLPFLYILIIDSLNRRLNRLKNEEIFPGISFVRGVQTINHAQFTDDTILLGSASTQIARRFKSSFDLFLKISRSKLNSHKSWH